ncbi:MULTISPECIES: hypothetical protein [unclassified Methanosarcina]|nr:MULTISPECIES: hypothetical protein [unclassified Methanosarcina]
MRLTVQSPVQAPLITNCINPQVLRPITGPLVEYLQSSNVPLD